MSVRLLIAGNWKMNLHRAEGVALAKVLADFLRQDRGVDMTVFPPATLLDPVASCLMGSAIALGGQDCHAVAAGAHTGDIAAAMLRDIGCTQVILGHSERRANHHENDSDVKAKAEAAHAAGLTAIICVGETGEDRDAGRAATVVRAQLCGSLPLASDASNTVVAYEPVWAIGTGKTARAVDIAAMHGHIRDILREVASDGDAMRILYGGSVKPKNAAEICSIDNVGGVLVGGASLDADDFRAIVTAVSS